MPETNFCSILIVLPIIFQPSFTGRRITSGNAVTSDNSFMVYLLSSATAPRQYLGWTCGGVIISKDYVVTSAACVQDILHIYVVPGYKKYVRADQMEGDDCVRKKKKKVILTCVPRNYKLDYEKTEVWARIDIAVVKVESPFDFNDATYETVCSYKPSPIEFNVEKGFPKTGDDVLILGWGHNDMWRKNEDTADYNQETLQYAGTKILDEEECLKYYVRNKEIAALIRASMLCTLESGNLNDKGELILKSLPGEGCLPDKNRHVILKNNKCEEKGEYYAEEIYGEIDYEALAGAQIITLDEYDTRRQETEVRNAVRQSDVTTSSDPNIVEETNTDNPTNAPAPDETNPTNTPVPDETNPTNAPVPDVDNPTNAPVPDENNPINAPVPDENNPTDAPGSDVDTHTNAPVPDENDNSLVPNENGTSEISKEDDEKRPGICQNDHGGPLIAWRGGKKILVGVATLFKLNKRNQCRGPFLFTKTWCNGVFLNCILESTNKNGTRRMCEDPAQVGFEIIRRHISWVGHRDGPADNERIQMRHQVPMSAFQSGKK